MSRSVRQTGPISIHTPLAGSDVHRHRHPNTLCYFNPHSPCRERLRNLETHRAKPHISIHTPLAGSDVIGVPLLVCGFNFNPHSPCGERPVCFERHHLGRSISIHTPLAGSDPCRRGRACAASDFNPHSPCGERPTNTWPSTRTRSFQSTLPLRGATKPEPEDSTPTGVSIHPPLAGSDGTGRSRVWRRSYFNPHSPCGERLFCTRSMNGKNVFQSTLPLRGATTDRFGGLHARFISIHTSLAGSDHKPLTIFVPTSNFNPHSPCGERHGRQHDARRDA